MIGRRVGAGSARGPAHLPDVEHAGAADRVGHRDRRRFHRGQAVVALTMIACGIGTILQAMRWRGIGSGYLLPQSVRAEFFRRLGRRGLARRPAADARHDDRRRPGRTGLCPPRASPGVFVSDRDHRARRVHGRHQPGTGRHLEIPAHRLFGRADSGDQLPGRRGDTAGHGRSQRLGQREAAALRRAHRHGVRLFAVGFRRSDAVRTRLARLPRRPGSECRPSSTCSTSTFRWSLVPVFVIVSICGALKSFGNLVMCEKVNDDEWKEPDIERIGDGLVADGICVTLSGVLGGVASDTSSSNVSLSSAPRGRPAATLDTPPAACSSCSAFHPSSAHCCRSCPRRCRARSWYSSPASW